MERSDMAGQSKSKSSPAIFNHQAFYNLNGTCAHSAVSATKSSSCSFIRGIAAIDGMRGNIKAIHGGEKCKHSN